MMSMRVVRQGPLTPAEVKGLERPTAMRQRATVGSDLRHEPPPVMLSEEEIDIPTFLRRQAD
jgi:hypothetical protein